MPLLKLHTQGSPILGKRAKAASKFSDKKFQKFLDDLIKACYEYDGVGIAAPQVGHSKRIFVMASEPNARYPHAPEMEEAEVVINPKVLWSSKETNKDWEGCLSVPGMRGRVRRPTAIRVRYTRRNGKRVEREFGQFLARLFLHEFDHLDGVLYPMRMEKKDKLITYDEFLKLMAKRKMEPELG